MTGRPDGWLLTREEGGWQLYHPLSGVMIAPNGKGQAWWVERTTPEERERRDDAQGRGYEHPDLHLQVTDAMSERDAEISVLLMGEALGAVRLTDGQGAWLAGNLDLDALLEEPK